VAFIDTPVDEVPLHDLGPKVEHNPMFPERVNFEIVNILDRSHVKVRVWERGSGLTMACGTGACAVVAVARQTGLLDDDVTVSLPGGELEVHWPGTGEVILEGPVEEVFEGDWPAQDTTS
jgi:diaminopimelate epimerase